MISLLFRIVVEGVKVTYTIVVCHGRSPSSRCVHCSGVVWWWVSSHCSCESWNVASVLFDVVVVGDVDGEFVGEMVRRGRLTTTTTIL